MNVGEIEQVLRKWPQAHIYYHDNGSWIIYQTRPVSEDEWLNTHPGKADAEYLDYVSGLEVYSGADYDGEGYESPLVMAMAHILGMTVESV